MRYVTTLPGLALLLLTVGSSAGADPLAAARAQFQAAYATAGAPPTGAPLPDSEALRSYPLYPYLQAARLQSRLEDPAAAGAIEALLREQGNAPAARSLRRSWLMSLAQRKAWESYLAAYRADVDDSAAGRCNELAARVALGRTDGLADAATAMYLSAKSLPDACDPAFDWLRTKGLLTRHSSSNARGSRWQRARLGLPASSHDRCPRRRPARSNSGHRSSSSHGANSRRSSRSRRVPSRPRRCWTAGRATRVPTPRARRTSMPRSCRRGRSMLAQRARSRWRPHWRCRGDGIRGRSSSSRSVTRTTSTSGRHEWHVRAALWAGDWQRVSRAIAAMPDTLRNQNRWRYWAGRAAERLGDRDAARASYAAVVPTDNWYAGLAAARLGERFTPTQTPLARDDVEFARVAADAGLVRTRELILCDLQSEANAEWRAALDALTPAQQTQAVRLASGWGWHLQAIAAAAKLGLFNDYELLYPRPYDAEVRRGAELTGLPPALIYAIIRQESLYRADAASSANALGLMQLLPSTAQATAKRAGLPPPTRTSLLQPSVNVPLGSSFLRSLIERAGGQWPLAIAGYNAGPAAARRWLAPTPVETDVWVENIPFNETRAYVQRVHWHALVFEWLAERKPRDTSGWLGTVRAPLETAGSPASE